MSFIVTATGTSIPAETDLLQYYVLLWEREGQG